MCWQNLSDGSRLRWWCKICRSEGKPWLTETPCDHIRTARGEEIPTEVALAMLEQLKAEAPDQA